MSRVRVNVKYGLITTDPDGWEIRVSPEKYFELVKRTQEYNSKLENLKFLKKSLIF
jgi:hypothetical protein